MKALVQFESDFGPVFVEVTSIPSVVDQATGPIKAGFGETVAGGVAKVTESFEGAVKRLIQANVKAFHSTIAELSAPPQEYEIKFGVKASSEIGHMVVAKASAEASFEVRLTWKSA
jgi:hypothetical protein